MDKAEVDKDREDVIELQNARTTVIGVGNYSVLINIVKHLSVRLIKAFWPLSAMWHRFLGLDRKQAAQQETWTGNMNLVKRTKKRACSSDSGDSNRDNKEMRREPATQQKNNKEKAICKAMQQVLG